jgi:hypothetical protein
MDLALSFLTKSLFIRVPPHPVSKRILARFKCLGLKVPFFVWTKPKVTVQKSFCFFSTLWFNICAVVANKSKLFLLIKFLFLLTTGFCQAETSE